MDLENAIHKHAEWKTKFRTAISKHEAMDAPTIGRDDCCELGKWLHGEGRLKAGQFAAYGDCVSKHALFHTQAAKVASAINAKRFAEAEAMLGVASPYTQASAAVGTAIMHLKREARL